jgi:hypothetical protein
MKFFEKTSVFLSGLMATGFAIFSAAFIVKYVIDLEMTLVKASSIATGFFGGTYGGFGISVFSILVMIIAFVDSNEKLLEEENIKVLVGVPLIINALTVLVTSLFADSFLSTLLFLAKIDLFNLVILLVSIVALSSIALTFTSKDIYYGIKDRIITFFNKKKVQREAIKKELKEIQATATEVLEKNYNLDIFHQGKNLPKTMNEKIIKLKNMIEFLKSKTKEVEVQTEIQMLLDNTLPKIIMLHEKANNETSRQEVENALNNVVSYFENFTQEMKNKDEYNEKLELETEISYINKKYLKQTA